jgi:hypothetical protein
MPGTVEAGTSLAYCLLGQMTPFMVKSLVSLSVEFYLQLKYPEHMILSALLSSKH